MTLRPLPFRKRHPFIFWGILGIILGCLCLFLTGFFSDKEDLAQEDSIALVTVRGAIMDPANTLAWIRKIEKQPKIRGVLLRVDSPGGGAAASQEIYMALARIGKKMPIAVSMGSMAASGGLMVSMAGERIFANPSTVTGSIGVRMDIPQLQGLMDKIGVGQETLVTAPFKDAASYTHPLTESDREYLTNVLMNMHDQFVKIVADGRKMPVETARSLANGKIFTGEQALSLGLVDELGGQYEAHAWLAKKTGVPLNKKLLVQPKKKMTWTSLLSDPTEILNYAALESLGAAKTAILQKLEQPMFLYQLKLPN